MTIRRNSRALGALTAIGALLAGGPALAAGYAVKEQSAIGQGRSFAGMATGAADLSAMYYNPAALGLVTHLEGSATGSVIVPKAEIDNTAANVAAGFPAPLGGAPLGGTQGDTDELGLVPSTYTGWRINDKVAVGLSINAPFGTVTQYDETWAGRYHATKSALTTITATPTIAFNPVPEVTIAAGFQAQYVDAELNNAVDFGTIGVAAAAASPALAGAFAARGITPVPGRSDGQASLTGDDWGFGFTLGFLVEPFEGTRFGVGFRSEIEHDVDGEATFALGASGVGQVLSAATGGFVDTPATTNVTTPASFSIGAYHEVTPRLAVMADAQWTQWSSFDELRVDFDNPAQAPTITTQDWDDSWFAAIGAEFKLNEKLSLRGGVAYDQSPVPDSHRTPRIPDSDRWWFSIGGSYAFNDHIDLHAGYSFVMAEDAKLALTATAAATDENRFRGSLSGDLNANLHILAVGATVRF